MRVILNIVFDWMHRSHHFSFFNWFLNVLDIPSFSNFMYLDKDFITVAYPKSFCELDCNCDGFSYMFLDLTICQDS
jgi:hypothetical protein